MNPIDPLPLINMFQNLKNNNNASGLIFLNKPGLFEDKREINGSSGH